jgi:hypothetical protein
LLIPATKAEVDLEVGKQQDLWASVSRIPATKAKELFNQTLGDLIIELQSAPAWSN